MHKRVPAEDRECGVLSLDFGGKCKPRARRGTGNELGRDQYFLCGGVRYRPRKDIPTLPPVAGEEKVESDPS